MRAAVAIDRRDASGALREVGRHVHERAAPAWPGRAATRAVARRRRRRRGRRSPARRPSALNARRSGSRPETTTASPATAGREVGRIGSGRFQTAGPRSARQRAQHVVERHEVHARSSTATGMPMTSPPVRQRQTICPSWRRGSRRSCRSSRRTAASSSARISLAAPPSRRSHAASPSSTLQRDRRGRPRRQVDAIAASAGGACTGDADIAAPDHAAVRRPANARIVPLARRGDEPAVVPDERRGERLRERVAATPSCRPSRAARCLVGSTMKTRPSPAAGSRTVSERRRATAVCPARGRRRRAGRLRSERSRASRRTPAARSAAVERQRPRASESEKQTAASAGCGRRRARRREAAQDAIRAMHYNILWSAVRAHRYNSV